MNLASELQHFENFQVADCVILFTGHGLIIGAGSSVLATSIEVDIKRPIYSIGVHT